MLPLYATLERMDWRLVDAATDLGASQWAAFRQITLRLTAPGLITGTLLVFIPMMGEYVIPLVLGGGRVDFIGNVIQRSFLEAQDYALGSALALLVMGALSFFVALYLYLSIAHGAGVRWLTRCARLGAFLGALALVVGADRGRSRFLLGLARRRGRRRAAAIGARARRGRDRARPALRPGRRALLGGYSALVYVFLFLPILVVVIYAFNSGNNVAVFAGFSTKWFSRALDDDTITSAIERSFQIAIASAIVATVFGTAAALALSRVSRRVRTPFDVLVFLTLVVPELVIAVSSLIFFVNVGFELGLVTMFLAHTVFNASLVLLIVRARFVSMGSSLEEASRDLGASALGDVPPGHAAAAGAGDRRRRDALVHVLVRRRRDLELHAGRRQRHVAAADPLRPALRPAARPQRRGDDDARRHAARPRAARR